MIYEFQVTTAQESAGFIKDFERKMRWIKQKGYTLDVQITANEEYGCRLISLKLQGENSDTIFRDQDIIYVFKHQISEALAEHIVNEWEEMLIAKEIMRSCKHMNTEDRKNVHNKALIFIRKRNENESLNLLFNFGRKNRMAHRILDYINNDAKLVVEGFINFYLQDFLTEIKLAVELAREELKSEKEYNDFISLLRYFVDTQSPKVNEVNLMISREGLFHLWDEDGCKIEDKYMNYYLDDIMLNEISLDDVLISILITIAPSRIVLHNTDKAGENEPVEMIKSVFKERLFVCPGCEHCRGYKENHH